MTFRLESEATAVMTVSSATGQVTLLGNSVDSVSIVARASNSTAEARTRFPCNVRPAIGDADLGSYDGAPLPHRAVGDTFEVPLRVNTGGEFLGAFDIFVHFDPSVLAVVGNPKEAVTFNRNQASIKSGILDAVVDGGKLHFSGSIDSETLRGSDALLVQIAFTAVHSGTSHLSGTVELLSNTAIPPVTIGLQGSNFVAGVVQQTVVPSDVRVRRLPQLQHTVRATSAPVRVARRASFTIQSNRERRCAQNEVGDANADCSFDVNDVRFITQYLAYRGIAFAGSIGAVVLAIVEGSEHSKLSLDADHNGLVSGKDARSNQTGGPKRQ